MKEIYSRHQELFSYMRWTLSADADWRSWDSYLEKKKDLGLS
jgi:hypothetical protein